MVRAAAVLSGGPVVDTFDVSMVSTWVFAFNPAPIALGKAATW